MAGYPGLPSPFPPEVRDKAADNSEHILEVAGVNYWRLGPNGRLALATISLNRPDVIDGISEILLEARDADARANLGIGGEL